MIEYIDFQKVNIKCPIKEVLTTFVKATLALVYKTAQSDKDHKEEMSTHGQNTFNTLTIFFRSFEDRRPLHLSTVSHLIIITAAQTYLAPEDIDVLGPNVQIPLTFEFRLNKTFFPGKTLKLLCNAMPVVYGAVNIG